LIPHSQNNAFYLIIGRFFQLIYSVISVKILTHSLPVEEVGVYYLVISLIGFYSVVFISPFGSYFTTKINQLNNQNNLYSGFLLLFLFSCSCFLLALPSLYYYLDNAEHHLSFEIIVLILFLDLVFGTLSSFIISSFNMLFYRLRFVLYTNIVLFIGLIFAIYLTTTIGEIAYNWLFGLMLAKLLICIIVLYDFKKVFKCHFNYSFIFESIFNRKKLTTLSRFCIPLSIAGIAVWAQSHYYRFYITEYFTLEALALLSIGFAMATNLTLAFESLVNQYFIPILYREIASNPQKKDKVYSKTFNCIVPLYLSFFIFLLYFSPLVLKILTNNDYDSAGKYMAWGIGIEFFRVLLRLFSNVLYLESKTKIVMYSSIIASVILLFLLFSTVDAVLSNLILIPVYILISALISFIMVMYKVNRVTILNLDYFKFIIISGLSSSVYLFSFYQHDNVFFDVLEITVAGISFVAIQFFFNKQLFINKPN
tara:strand:- start:10449 stop:11891 length:1443 start_codon:yes stop_codon:yes gene_type:complete